MNYVTNEWRDTGRKIILPGQRRGRIEEEHLDREYYYVDDKGVMVKNSRVHTDGKDGLKEEGLVIPGQERQDRGRLEERRRRLVQL